MKTDPFAVLPDPRVASVLQRLHAEADKQNPGLLFHSITKIPRLLLRMPVDYKDDDIRGYYADKYIALEREQAAFCYLTAKALRARHVVEFGSSFGISTIWLAAAVRDNGGGTVIGTELLPEKAERARANVEEAGLSDVVEIRVGDARETLVNLDADVDLLLNDGFPMLALDILEQVAPRMREGGVVITDNVGTCPGNYLEYLEYLRRPGSQFASMTLPFKSGTEYSVRLGH